MRAPGTDATRHISLIDELVKGKTVNKVSASCIVILHIGSLGVYSIGKIFY